jgi:ATP-dependent DNA ligase
VRRVPGWVGVSNGTWIDLAEQANSDSQTSSRSSSHAPVLSSHDVLIHRFSQVIADYEEGLVLKPCSGGYNDSRARWVKMKKDYIPGLGDCADFVVVGAAWERERGRELGRECIFFFF